MKIEFLHRVAQAARHRAARPAGRLPAALCAAARRARAAARTCAIACPAARALGRAADRLRARAARCRACAATRSFAIVATRAPARRRARATSCCSSTRSTTTSSPRTRAPRARVLEAAGYARRASRRAEDDARPLCCGRTFLAARAGRRGAGAKRGASLDALAPYVAARRRRSSGSSRRACCRCATSSSRCGSATAAERARRARAAVRGVPRRASARPAGSRLPLQALPQTRALRARPLPSEGVRRVRAPPSDRAALDPGARGRRRSSRAAAAWRALRLRGRALRRVDARWPSCRCCPRCARRRRHADRRRRHELPPPDRRRRARVPVPSTRCMRSGFSRAASSARPVRREAPARRSPARRVRRAGARMGIALPDPDFDAITRGTLAHYDAQGSGFAERSARSRRHAEHRCAALAHRSDAAVHDPSDLGCGPGRDLSAFTSLGHVAIGLDGAQATAPGLPSQPAATGDRPDSVFAGAF